MAETAALVPAIPTPMELLDKAVAQNLDIDKLAKLLELQERWENRQAQKAFVEALNKFKANPPQISKSKPVDFKDVHYSYSPLYEACDAIIPALSKVGITHRWVPEQTNDGRIVVT